MKLIHISVQSSDARVMEKAAKTLRDQGINVECFCENCDVIDDNPEVYHRLVKETADADMVFIRCMGDIFKFKKFEKYEKVLKDHSGYVFIYSGSLDLMLLFRNLFKGSDDDFSLLRSFALYKGPENDIGILLWLANKLGLVDSVPEPVKQRTDGIYHPDYSKDISFEDYISNLDPNLPTAGFMFTSNLWIYNNLEHIDAMIHGLEDAGMNVIPVFFSASSMSVHGTYGSSTIFKKYLMDGEKSRVDVVVMCSSFSQLVNSRSTTGMSTPDEENFYKHLTNVPVLQALIVASEYSDYGSSAVGLDKNEISASVAWPEVDGQIITVPIAHSPPEYRKIRRNAPLPDRINHLARLAKNWAMLSRIPPSERRIAILMYQSRPDSGRIGNAAGLDVIESVCSMLKRLKLLGYSVDNVPETGKELITEILENVTNDLEWTPSEVVCEKALDLVDKKDYLQHFDKLSEFDKNSIIEHWGKPPGEIAVEKGKIIIPGLIKGNILIGYQPLRGWGEQIERIYHDPLLMSPHQYLEYYRWIQHEFKANVIVHMGTHGTLEWLPGKNVGLSSSCNPDFVLDATPHVYPYIIDDPGEGIQTKRRSEAVVIGHMNPTMARAGSYDELSEVEVPLQQYFKFKNMAAGERRTILISEIYEAAKKLDLFSDLGISADPGVDGFEPYLDKLHEYITEVKDALIRDGLHVLGRIPEERHLDENIYSIMRVRNGSIAPLREAVGDTIGYDLNRAVDFPNELSEDGRPNSEIIDYADSEVQTLLVEMRTLDYNYSKCLDYVNGRYSSVSNSLIDCVSFICNFLVPNLKNMGDEINNMMDAFEGKYVLPGPSGAPTRGNARILPMGRNYYGIDPDSVPNPSSWVIGKKMADLMINKYVEEKGTYPREVGFIIWATDTMKTGGDDLAYILWLMGVKPVWSKSGGQVIDLEVVPLSELKRPRIDVTVNITGLFRDTFPNLIDMIDDAVKLVSALDESSDENYLADNLRKEILEGMKSGLTVDEARRKSSMRIFGAPPGAYGAGVNHAIETSEWKTVEDLADVYISWSSYAYGRGVHGESMKDQFVKRFSKVGVTVKNMPDREIDLLDCDDVYTYLGGMNSFVRAYGNPDAISVMGDGSNPEHLKLRNAAEECKFVFRSKILNPKYVEGLKEHGYRGAAELANVTEYLFAWDATSDIVDDWMYEQLADKFLFDNDTKEWMMDENPHALMNILNRLHEAISREMWNADQDTLEKLKQLYMQTEERLEEITDR
ncbi:cobaltochelatase subunit CobN [Candidatus Methanomassiliicoccus intestinalis]|uniref:cobaltochelatase subunit CobN n=1 Tax=Candidatus Methanomassiliicoccus intestinalis TaxID=1406512 RepID=UPI0037DC42EC